MDFLRGFTDIVDKIREKPFLLVPSLLVIVVALIFDLVFYAARGSSFENFYGFAEMLFIFGVIKWALAFTAVGLTVYIISDRKITLKDSRFFFNLFAFSVFMGFFLMIGFTVHVLLGLIFFFFMLYVPIWFVKNERFDAIDAFKWNIFFIFQGIRSAYAFIILVGTVLLTLIPYVGIYLAIFFYILLIVSTYMHIEEEK